jgi:hypothetical protein
MKIAGKTLFDCSATGVTGHYRPAQIPFVDRSGQTINNQAEWNRSRNQQRNWETILQVLGLRTQPEILVEPYCQDGVWHFEFETSSEGVYDIAGNPDPVAGLLQDCDKIPMVVNLDENVLITPVLSTSGKDQNIWFAAINI